ncbi:MAG: Asp-tRNA(Asn)/Glu-tRNA(Gln) amidotransferase subunit GatC [Alphaproteobacteria bacterium]
MALDKDKVAHIARLARIRVEDKDLAPIGKELDQILSWIEQLNEVDTANIEPMTSVASLKLKRRADQVTDGGYPEKIVANAPAAAHGYFTVPKVVE